MADLDPMPPTGMGYPLKANAPLKSSGRHCQQQQLKHGTARFIGVFSLTAAGRAAIMRGL